MDQTRDQHDYRPGDQRRWQGTASAPPQTDPEAFAANFRSLSPALYDFLDRLTGRDETANALMRQVASQAAMSAASADQWPSVRAWLFARAYAALPAETSSTAADPGPYIVPDPSLLPPVAPESGLDDMTRAVWRAISALPVEQHALVHLHIREAMVVGEAASVLGITEREASDRLQRLIPAVESASRALFLIRFGRPRDPELDALLADLNITRLTPEARATIEEYAETSPTARAMLDAVPPPLTVYAALRPIPPPAPIAEAAIAGALPWLPLVEQATTALDLPPEMPTTAIPEAPVRYGTDAPTDLTPVAEPWQYGDQQPAEEPYGTRALDIPVRQRVVQDDAVFVPPRSTNRARGPLALLGLLGGALIVIVGALVLFLVRGDSTSGVSVTATVGSGTATPTIAPTSGLPAALLTSTAVAATIGTPTPIPTATTAPLPESTIPVGSVTQPTSAATPTPLGTEPLATTAIATVAIATSTDATAIATPVEAPTSKVTPLPRESPTPRVTPIPTEKPVSTQALVHAPTATRAATVKSTTAPTTGAGGTITLNKGSIALGSAGASGTVTLGNAGLTAVGFTAKSSTTWLSASPSRGSVPADGSLPVAVTINRAGLAPGNYSGTVTFTTPSGSVSVVTVTFTV
ncbi:MAG: BACON domain-containing protein [Thermomicrobiales bacterium]